MTAPLRQLDDEQERDVVIGRALAALEDLEVLLLTAAEYRRTVADAGGRACWRDPVEGGVRTQAEAVARVRREHRR